jgi:hypothetical protein
VTSRAIEYIEGVTWRFAKTMPDWPHEYTVKSWLPELAQEFMWFCQLIQHQGTVEAWPPVPAEPIYHNRYVVIGPHKYWAMGPHGDRDPVEEMTVINRALLSGDNRPLVSPM